MADETEVMGGTEDMDVANATGNPQASEAPRAPESSGADDDDDDDQEDLKSTREDDEVTVIVLPPPQEDDDANQNEEGSKEMPVKSPVPASFTKSASRSTVEDGSEPDSVGEANKSFQKKIIIGIASAVGLMVLLIILWLVYSKNSKGSGANATTIVTTVATTADITTDTTTGSS